MRGAAPNGLNPKKHKYPHPEMTLPPDERRRRAKRFARMMAGSNALTRRQIRHIPSKARKSKRMMRRFARRQGFTLAEVGL